MALIKSISGIRGTIGGNPGENLTPIDVVKYASAYGMWCKERSKKPHPKVVIGRDARISGEIVKSLVISTLCNLGIDVIDIDLASTPTTEIAVVEEKAQGGIIITASHNPGNWNALKLLNEKGEFLNAQEGAKILELANNEKFDFVTVDSLGVALVKTDYDDIHIQQILQLDLVDKEAITKADFHVAIDGINSVGGRVVPKLLQVLGVNKITCINCEPTGIFVHIAEPLPENLQEISQKTQENNIDVGFVVDPDVDRLSIICEDGSFFGEEYTIVALADYILQHEKGATVSNLSSSRALRDVSKQYNCDYFASAVGEVNVVEQMKKVNAVFGGEGNGGVIYPKAHYGRDALVGIALFLTYLAKLGTSVSELRKKYPEYTITKNKISLDGSIDVDMILQKIEHKFTDTAEQVSTIDGVKIDFADGWVHLRKSNTEPIIRIYAESKTQQGAEHLTRLIMEEVNQIIGKKTI